MPTWDDLIEETARRLTDGHPRIGFAARVVVRLDEPARRRSRVWLLVSAGAVAIVVLAIVMPREKRGDPASNLPVETVRADVRQRPDATPDAASPGRGPLNGTTLVPRIDSPARAPAAAGTARPGLEPDPNGDVVPVPLTELAPEPIEVAPLVVSAAVVDALPDLTPLAIEEITIGAIDFAQ